MIKARTEKTSRHSAKCEWNEKIVFQSYYPSLCQTFIIQILRKEFVSWKTYALKNIHFEETTFTSGLNEIRSSETSLQVYFYP